MLRPLGVLVVVILSAMTLARPAWTQQADRRGVPVQLIRDARIEGRRAAIVSRDWLYCYPPTRELILVPRGYVTDFASIPPAARGLIDVFGDNAEAAVVHDWLYAVGEPGGHGKADDVLRYALMEQHVGVVTRNAMHWAVSSFGGGAYGRTGEWDRRFGDPEQGVLLEHAPFARRTTAVVGVIEGSCARMDDPAVLTQLYATYRSADWPPS
jgi:uncharacterized protein DUF1353